MFKNYYDILGLKGCNVSQEDIKKAYRLAAKKYHPDTNVGNIEAEEKIKDINEAYSILSDRIQKKKYDRKYNSQMIFQNSIFNQEKSVSSIISEMIFGKNEKAEDANKIQSLNTKITIDIKEAFNGCQKELKFSQFNKKTNITIPKGTNSGKIITIPNFNINGQDNCNVFIDVCVCDYNFYHFENNKLYYNVYITPLEAILGKKIIIENLDSDDEIIEFEVPKLCSSDDEFEIENKGFYLNFSNDFRDKLYIKIHISSPKFITSMEQELYEKLYEIKNQSNNI